jgi:hypothetical protein
MRLFSEAITPMFAVAAIVRELILDVLVGASVLALGIFIIVTAVCIGLLWGCHVIGADARLSRYVRMIGCTAPPEMLSRYGLSADGRGLEPEEPETVGGFQLFEEK